MVDNEVKKDFDLEVVLKGFKRCPQDDGSLLLSEYLHAFKELCRFFKLMGRIFKFVAKDLEGKIQILDDYLHGPHKEEYHTIQSMIQYELSQNLTTVKTPQVSGSRTLLRLHRALEFIIQFMRRIAHSGDEEKVSHVAMEVYDVTLARYHVWLVRKMAVMAMYTLPYRRTLIEMMCIHDVKEVEDLLDQVTDAGQPLYDVCQELFAQHGMLNLP